MSYDVIVAIIAAAFGIGTGLAIWHAIRDDLDRRNDLVDRTLDQPWGEERPWGERHQWGWSDERDD